MQLYLSSYKLGNEAERLLNLFKENKRVAYIPNALDFSAADPVRKSAHIQSDVELLSGIGLQPEVFDLRDYFDGNKDLRAALSDFAGVWVSGGNVFVLRQAMKVSGFDTLLTDELRKKEDFVYGGYSAAGCVLSKTLDAYKIVDDATDTPYEQQKDVLWDGIGLLDFAFLPHFDSDHAESDAIDKEILYCKEQNIPYKTLRDGEALILTLPME